jgi:hypothetical protein
MSWFNMSVTLDECAVRAMRKKLKLNSEGGDCGSKKCKPFNNGVWRSQNVSSDKEKNIIANVRHAFNTKFYSRELLRVIRYC